MDLHSNHSLKWVAFFIGIIASWLTFSKLLPFFVFILIWLSIFVFLVIQKSYLRFLLILFSSWVFIPLATFVKTSRHYFKGDATFMSADSITNEFYNFDRSYRVWRVKAAPVLWGDEVLPREANNFAVRFWVTLRGYQPNAYAGTYPDPYHAEQIISTQGKVFPFEKSVNAIRIKFDNGVYEMFDPKHLGSEDVSGVSKALVTIINDELVLVKPIKKTPPSIIYLVDYKTRFILARYFDAEKAIDVEGEKQKKEERRSRKRSKAD